MDFRRKIIQITQSITYKNIVITSFVTCMYIFFISAFLLVISLAYAAAGGCPICDIHPRYMVEITFKTAGYTTLGMVSALIFCMISIALEPNTLAYGTSDVNWKRDGF